MQYRALLASLLAAPLVSIAGAQTPPSASVLAAQVDSVVRVDVLAQGMPSASVVIMRGNDVVLERAWGVADAATGRKAEPSTTYQVASVSKQFTAALVLKLVDRGKLSVADPIGRYLPGLRPEMQAITVDQLLNHTSGLKGDFRRQERATELTSRDSLFAMAARDSLAARPGTAYLYSNTGYMLLGMLIEKLYARPYADALRDEIAKPLGLESLWFCEPARNADAQSYMRSPQKAPAPLPSIHPSQLLGSGGICSTARDIATWNRALHGGRVLSAASYAAMTTPHGVAAPKAYGYGLFVRPAPWGSMAMVHEGTTSGYASANGWYPAESLSVVVLYNGVPRVPVDVDGVITELAFGRTPARTAPEPVVAAAPAKTVPAPEGAAKFVGDYELRTGMAFTVSLEDGVLYIKPPGSGSRQVLWHKSGTSFGVGGVESPATATFVSDASGVVTELNTRQGSTERTMKKVR